MSAMTMPYKVRDANEFAPLAPGDSIYATLVVVSNDAYLKDVTRSRQRAAGKDGSSAGAPTASSGFELLKDGEPVPDTKFIDQEASRWSSLR